MKQTNAPLFGRDFTLVVIGQIISLFGNAVLRFALPLYLLRETGSPALFGAVGAAALVYLILVVALRMITREDLKLVPHGEALARLLHIR